MSRWLRPISAFVGRFSGDKRGNVAMIVALAMVPLAGVMGMAAEGSSWFLSQRAQQNAADAAVVAAANMALQDYYANCASTCSWGTTYPTEGKAVAAQYGYLNGSGTVTVNVQGPDTPVACPANVTIQIGGAASCFQVTVAKSLPLYMTKLLGFNGNKGGGVEWISASAIAGPVVEPGNVCLFTKGWGPYASNGTKYAMDFHGSSGVNLEGCPVGSNGGMDCTGASTLNSPYGVEGDDPPSKVMSGCGNFYYSEASAITDPYIGLASDIPSYSGTCGGSYGGQTGVTTGSGTATAPATVIVCGNLTLSGNTSITGVETIVIANGYLDLAGNTLSTAAGAGVTIIFTSPNYASLPPIVVAGNGINKNSGTGYIEDSVGGGGINISSEPKGSGDFQGVAVYQDPTPWNNGGSVQTYNSTWDGNSSSTGWSLSGAYYLPNANLTLNGATDKASNGYNCFDMVTNSIVSNGGNTYSMFANPLTQCGQNGTVLPQIYGFRYALVG